MSGLSVLSFGYTRGLWEGEGSEDFQRMTGYAAHLDDYVIVANSYKRHGLKPRQLAPGVKAIPTNAFCFADSFFRMLRIGARVLRERRITIIQAQDPGFTGLAAALLGWRFGVPVNVCVYGPNVFDPHWVASHWSHPIFARIGRWVLRRARGIQVDGKMTARSLIDAGFESERVHLKPMIPANLDRFLAIARPTHDPAQTPRLLFVGRLATQKNLPMLIDAASRLKARGRSFELLIVGDGPEEARLRAIAAKSGLNGSVRFQNSVSRDEITDVFASADLFVLSSDYEGYPRVLMEAAAAALPVVSTAVSGSDESIADGVSGCIVPIGGTELFVGKIDLLLGDHALRSRMGAAAREHARARLDPAGNTPQQLAIWQKIATSRKPAPVKNLLLFNLVTDAKHPILGFTSQWIRELASRVDHVEVITMCAGEIAVPANVRVHSAGRERGWSEPRRAVEFYRLLFRILRERRIDGCFSHMMPIFSALAGPVLRVRGIPLVTWYAHPSLTPTLKLAHFASHRMVTSLPRAYPYRHDKLSIIGQGIDTTHFAPDPASESEDDLILCIGRLSRVKNHPTLLRAFARLPERFRLEILGATAGTADEVYSAELHALAKELGITARVDFAQPVAPKNLPAEYRRCAVHVNLTPAGFGDKVAWEAMSCARPCLVANDDFRDTLGDRASELLFRENDDADLAKRLSALLAKSAAERDATGRYLRAQVERLHSLPRLADRILGEIGNLIPEVAKP